MSYFYQLLLLVCIFCLGLVSSTKARFTLTEEWKAWKSYHGKNYESELEEIEKHIVWQSNKEYVDKHNANAHIFGFNLDLNHLGDMVSGYWVMPGNWKVRP